MVVQTYQTLAEIVSKALGGKSSPQSDVAPEGAMVPKTNADVAAALRMVLGNV